MMMLALFLSFAFQSTTDVPMLDIGGRPMVEVMVNGKGPYSFILDTGASATVVSPDLLTELGVAGGSGRVHVDELKVGDAILRDVMVVAAGGLGGLGPNAPRGVLSALAFPGSLVTLDYVGKRVTIAKGALPAADGKRVFQYEENETLPVVPVRVAGKEIRIHVDSGSPAGVTLPMKYQSELPLTGEPVQVGRARTVAGEFPVFAATINGSVELGEFALNLTRISLSDLRPGSEPGIGNIGAEVLKTFKVTVDSKNRRVRFER